jgi:tRNA-specific 2-thiouridylase
VSAAQGQARGLAAAGPAGAGRAPAEPRGAVATGAGAVDATRAVMRLPAGARVAVAMSGGVDSSTVAGLLVEAGYQVIGLTARLHDLPPETLPHAGACCAPRDAADARAVAAALGFPHYVIDERAAFAQEVIARAAADYEAARTPNPCVECNRSLKFDRLLRRARLLGAQALATGHYARLEPDGAGALQLRRGADASKDQSYFLHPLRPDQAGWLRFPLGRLLKAEVRAHARRLGLPTAEKAESMDLCFTAGQPIGAWLAAQGRSRAGAIVALDGTRLGQHAGLAGFTIGQRRGLGGGGQPARYVVDKRRDGTIVVGDRAALRVAGLELERVGGVSGALPAPGERLGVQWRHRGAVAAAEVIEAADERLRLRLLDHAEAAAPGQSAVLYRGDVLRAGGVIARVWREEGA